MPTQRFYNLKEEKRMIIKQAAMEECARVPYAEISINKIIKAADISRGSFYTYFEDKDDMIKYLLDDFRIACMNFFYGEIEREGGDLITALEKMTINLMEHGLEYPNAFVYRNLLLNVGAVTNMKTCGFGTFLYDSPEYIEFVDGCYQRNNPEKCPFKDKRQLAVTMEIIVTTAIRNVAIYHMFGSAEKEKFSQVVYEQLEIVRRGLG
ncbi:TetR/AcrR family transcriptional regulator [Lachnospiraceae bacterium 62-35]